MDRLSSTMLRASFAWLLAGIVLGGLMLADRAIPGDWRRWVTPTHAHMLFVGWFLQFAVGVAYWLLPRRRTAEQPLGYDERLAVGSVLVLNLGLLLRVVAEPAERAAGAGDWTLATLVVSAVFQVGAVSLFIAQLWPRVGPRPARAHEAARGEKRKLNHVQ